MLELHEAFAGQVLSNLKALESEKFCQEKLGLNQKVMKSCCRRRQESVQSIAVPDLRWGRFPWRSSTTGAAPYPLDILSELQVDAWLEEIFYELNISFLSFSRHPTAEPCCTPAGG